MGHGPVVQWVTWSWVRCVIGHVDHRYMWVMGQLFSGSRGHGLDV